MIVLQVVGAVGGVLELGRLRLESAGAHAIAVRREFELDDLGAHLGEQPGAGRPRDELGEIENPIAFEHARLISHESVS